MIGVPSGLVLGAPVIAAVGATLWTVVWTPAVSLSPSSSVSTSPML